jgi:hypothetical protein
MATTAELANQQTAKEITIAALNRSNASATAVSAAAIGELASAVYTQVLKAVVAAPKA